MQPSAPEHDRNRDRSSHPHGERGACATAPDGRAERGHAYNRSDEQGTEERSRVSHASSADESCVARERSSLQYVLYLRSKRSASGQALSPFIHHGSRCDPFSQLREPGVRSKRNPVTHMPPFLAISCRFSFENGPWLLIRPVFLLVAGGFQSGGFRRSARPSSWTMMAAVQWLGSRLSRRQRGVPCISGLRAHPG